MKPNKTKIIIANVVVTLVLLMGLEAGYRAILNQQIQKDGLPYYFFATSAAGLEYNRDLAYDYLPGHRSHTAVIKKGELLWLYTNRINSVGIPGRDGIVDPDADLKILAAGDSFTALPYSDKTWPEALHDILETPDQSVSIRNVARDGYGILQMVHSAAAALETNDYDHLVIAFISDDMTRGRFWRYHLADNDPPRVINTTTSDPENLAEVNLDAYLVDARVTPEWVNKLLAAPELQKEDPLFQELLTAAIDRRQAFMKLPLLSVGYSAVLNNLLKGDPHAHVNQLGRNPRHSYMDYAEDPLFMSDLKRIKDSGVQLTLVRLPEVEEALAGSYRDDPKISHLIENLESLLGVKAHPLDSLLNLSEDEVYKLYLYPHDVHPNQAGMEYFARVISEQLKKKAE